MTGFTKKPLCPFCSAEWTDDMMDLQAWSEGYESTGYYSAASIDINCSSCKMLIYRKEI